MHEDEYIIMKRFFLVFTLFIFQSLISQENKNHTFFIADGNLTFGINENYELGSNSDETFIVPRGTLLRFGFGYEINNQFAVSFNSGFDYHFTYSIMSIPAYIGFRYNLWHRGNQDAFFINVNTGKLWRPAERFSDGNYRAFGLGYRFESGGRWTPTLKLMYHRTKIKNFEDGKIDSFSIGFGVMFF